MTRRHRLLILVAVLFVALVQSGCVAPGNLGVSATNLNFGGVPVGSSKSQIVTIMNSGGGPFTITNAAVSGKGFDITAPLLPLTLAVGQSAKFTMRFAPAAIGDTSGSVLITKTQISSPQLQSGSASTTPSITSQQETIAMTGAGVPVTPSITTQPASQTVTAGQTATFSVTSSGAAPLSYQWSKNGTAISGATSTTYTTPATTTSDSGSQFTVVVSNSAGNVTSNAAILTVTAADVAPSITTQPANQMVTVGQTATFSVTASGTSPLNYQWRKNGTAINDATSSSYTTSATAISDSGSAFTVAISNSKGGMTSNTATLTVNAASLTINVSPNSATVKLGSTQQFAGIVTGTSNTAVTWTVSGGGCTGAACGTISSAGLYIPPSSVPSPATVTVTATSVADPTKSASANAAIVAALAVLLSISPTSASVPTVGTQLFSASVTGTSNTAVTWSVSGTGCSGSACGTISTSASSAVYSAPSVAPAPASVSVTATSAADPTKSASASVTIILVIAVTVNPPNASVPTGTTQQFNASVTGTSNTAVAWSVTGPGCSGVACGTINSSGLYTAPAVVPSPATVTVTATSAADPTKSSTDNLTILSSVKSAPVLPTLPQATVDITMPVQTGTVRNVAAGNAAAFQAAINAATCGDTIVLVAGSTYTGNFTIPNKACSGWILIESSALASLPPSGTRVSGACSPGTPPATVCPPPSTANMATITSGVANNPTITFQTAAHNWRLIGLEITQTAGLHDYGLIETDNGATTLANLVSYLIIDRCYIHGTASGAVRRGISFQVASGAIIDSDIREIHDQSAAPGAGSDSQAIVSWSGVGPFLIRNNFLSAATENVMFGGSDPSITNTIASDITIVGNHFWKDYTAWHGNGFAVKNLLEFKAGQRALVDGNVFEFTWVDAQNGYAILMTPRSAGACNLCSVNDITVTHNLIQHTTQGIDTAPSNDNLPCCVTLPTNRVLIQNNIMGPDVSSANFGSTGGAETDFLATSVTNSANQATQNNLTIDHNTVLGIGNFVILGDSGTIPQSQITNNIAAHGAYGVLGTGYGSGSSSLNAYVPTGIWNDNLLLTVGGGNDGNTWPTGTHWSSTSGTGFTNYSVGNYQLGSGSAYRNAGTDGKDIGVWDWTTFNTETTNALNGIYR